MSKEEAIESALVSRGVSREGLAPMRRRRQRPGHVGCSRDSAMKARKEKRLLVFGLKFFHSYICSIENKPKIVIFTIFGIMTKTKMINRNVYLMYVSQEKIVLVFGLKFFHSYICSIENKPKIVIFTIFGIMTKTKMINRNVYLMYVSQEKKILVFRFTLFIFIC